VTTSDPGDNPDSGQGESLPPTHQPYGQPQQGQSPYGQPEQGQSPYGQPEQGQSPYGQPQYGQPEYGQQPASQPPYGQQPYGATPGYGYPGQAPANHPSATTALVLSLVGLVGFFVCGLPLALSPFAWRMGARAVREIDANPGMYAGRDQANAARIIGLIGTVLLGLVVLAFVAAFAVLMVASVSTSP
jgi:hypothetical protein